MNVGVDMGSEQVGLGQQLLLSSLLKGFFHSGDSMTLDGLLNNCSAVVAYLSYNTNVF